MRNLVDQGFALVRSVDGKSFVVTNKVKLNNDPDVVRVVGEMTHYVEGLVRDGRRIKHMCSELPWEARRLGITDHILTTWDAHNGKIDDVHNVAGKTLRRWFRRSIHIAFDPTARGFVFGGDSGPAEAETVAFVTDSNAALGRALRAFYGGSFERSPRTNRLNR